MSGLSTNGRTLAPGYREPLREKPRVADLKTSTGCRFGLRHLLFCASLVVLMFSNEENNAVLFQVMGVGLVILSGAMFFITGPSIPMTIASIDAVMLFSVLLSYLATTITQDTYAFMHTTVFLITYLSIMVIAQRATDDELITCIQVSTVVILAIVVVVFGGTLLTALTPGALRRWELRQAPFGMHPNLAGFVYGAFIVMAASSWINMGGYLRLMKPIIIVLSLAVMVAASARGGLLAVVLTFAVYVFTEMIKERNSRVYFLLFGFVLAVLSIIYWDSILAYATEVFDLNSRERGLQSGGTGRFGIWEHGVDYIADRSWQIFIGSGLRSATDYNMGFPTENSYINIAVESGVFLTAIILINFLMILLYSHRQKSKGSGFYRFAFYTLLFAMFQSVFNRYLIAIGNPFSILLLIIGSKASVRYK